MIKVKVAGKTFTSKIDERGRFGVPIGIRGDSVEVEGVISVCNGRCGVTSTYKPVELVSRVKLPMPAPLLQGGCFR